MLAKYNKLRLKPKMIDELKVALQTIWEELPQEHINKAVENFTKGLTAGVAANGEHFEHMQQGFIYKFVSSSPPQKTGSFQNHPHTKEKTTHEMLKNGN